MERPSPLLLVAAILFYISYASADRGDYIGCYKLRDDVLNTHAGQSVDVCLSACEQVYYKYALIGNESTCFCGNDPGTPIVSDSCNTPCPKNETQKCGGDNVASVYDTEVTAPGPPMSLEVINITETTVRLRWTPPQAFTRITGYVIKAVVLETYAVTTLSPVTWAVSNTSLQSELPNLHPGSKYNITVAAINYKEEGVSISTTAETDRKSVV